MTNLLRVAAVQFQLKPETSFSGFQSHLSEIVGQAVNLGAELVVFPELVGTGLLASRPDADSLLAADMKRTYRELFPPVADDFAHTLSALATRHGIAIMGGSHYRRAQGERFRNTAYLAHADGRVERQDKLHLTPPETAIGTDPGDDLIITTIGPARVAILICMDLQYPELARHLSDRGVDVVLCPSLTWNRRGANRMRYASHSRAMENQVFVVTSVLLGTCGIPLDSALHGTGRAIITCPINATFGIHDGLLATAPDSDESVVVGDLDLEQLHRSRANPEPPGLVNRRPELYRRLSEQRESHDLPRV